MRIFKNEQKFEKIKQFPDDFRLSLSTFVVEVLAWCRPMRYVDF